MKKSNSYFMLTFQINEIMLLGLLIFGVIRFPLEFVEKNFLTENNITLLQYSMVMRDVFGKILQVMNSLIVIFLGAILLLIIPELIYRITNDSLKNWIYSVCSTYKMRKFLLHDKDRIIQNATIDIRKKKIVFIGKLKNDIQSQRKYINMKDILYKEIINQFPKYSFSQIERHKHWVMISGSRI